MTIKTTRRKLLEDAREQLRKGLAGGLVVSLADAKLLLASHGAKLVARYGNDTKTFFVVVIRYHSLEFCWSGRNAAWTSRILAEKKKKGRKTG